MENGVHNSTGAQCQMRKFTRQQNFYKVRALPFHNCSVGYQKCHKRGSYYEISAHRHDFHNSSHHWFANTPHFTIDLPTNGNTGANSGIGFASSKVLVCKSNTFHVIMACRSLEKARAAVSEIEAIEIKGTLSALQLDVTDEVSIQNAVSVVETQFGRLDVLVNNAGVGGLITNIKDSYKLCLETNVMGPAMVADAFRPLLFKSNNPYSIFISSGARTLLRNAHEKPPSHAHIQNGNAYQVSKAAINMLSVLEARDHGPDLKVFAMSPGFVRSNLRGTNEDARSGWGQAGDPEESGELLLSIVQGTRDEDVGCLVHKDGVFAW